MNKRLTIILALGVIAIGMITSLLGFNYYKTEQEKDIEQKFKENFTSTRQIKATALTSHPIASEATKLVEFKFDENVLVATIENPSELAKDYSFFTKASKGDILIATPKQTVIFDSATRTIKDISSEIIYDRLAK